ncbi:PIG-M-domain-containing protein [Chytriomyces cf. hyalinus JEL632]|nr:PIG-M-domain-containing protein [Chytriomyces cf. hyalinus JEL632]
MPLDPKHNALALVSAVTLRLILALFGVWQDSVSAVKYTDIDYAVFTDAAALVSTGSSPYARATYRYTPLLAWLLVYVNGKFLFCACDVLAAICIHWINELNEWNHPSVASKNQKKRNKANSPVKSNKQHHSSRWLELSLWALNPFVAVISTRGNAESIIASLVLLSVFLLMCHRIAWAGIAFGLAVHLKVYAIIYALPFWLYINHSTNALPAAKIDISNLEHSVVKPELRSRSRSQSRSRSNSKALKGGQKASSRSRSRSQSKSDTKSTKYMAPSETVSFILHPFFTYNRLLFAATSASTFLLLGAVFYKLYGHEFLQHTYLYHITRQDHRHNFSLYFYHLYLDSATLSEKKSAVSGLVAFLPQLGLSAFVSVKAAIRGDIVMALFAQTFVFVMLNKVMTSQYFMWYLCFLPIILQRSSLVSTEWRKGVTLLGLWIASQALWLGNAYRLEHLGVNTFRSLHFSGLAFACVNGWILVQVVLSCCVPGYEEKQKGLESVTKGDGMDESKQRRRKKMD